MQKTKKQLIEERSQLRQSADRLAAGQDPSWNRNLDHGYCSIMRAIEAIDCELAAHDQKLAAYASLDSGSSKPVDDLSFGLPGRSRKSATGSSGTQLSENFHLFKPSESVQATFGQSDIGLGDIIRAKVLGDSAALSVSDPTSGGYTVSAQVAAGVIDLARSKSVLTRAGMQFGTMNSSEMRMPKLTSDPSYQIKAENHEFNEANMQFGALVFYPVLIGTFITMSRELAEDSIGFSAIVEQALADSFAAQLDGFPLNGASGGGVRVGLLDDDENIGETGSTGSLTWAKIAAEATTIRGQNHEPSAVLLHPSKRDVVMDTTATGSGEWLNAPPSLSGVQMLDSTKITATKGLVGDFTKLIMVVRGGPLIEVSNVSGDAFKRHQVHVKLTWRGDYGVTHGSAFRRLAGIS